MAEQVEVTKLPDGSKERVAYDLYRYLVSFIKKGDDNSLEKHLKLFAACRDAAHGLRYDISALT